MNGFRVEAREEDVREGVSWLARFEEFGGLLSDLLFCFPGCRLHGGSEGGGFEGETDFIC